MLPPNEKIVETKTCLLSGEEFFITNRDLAFYDSVSPVLHGKKYVIPSPTLCPDERQRRILAFRNEGKLYHRICDLTGKPIISMYAPECPKKVYHHEVWWTDAWNPLEYGVAFDFTRDFFSQFDTLFRRVPVPALHNSNNENCEFNNHIMGCRDCYMCAVAYYGVERAYYCEWVYNSKDIIDGKLVYDCENCYECVQAKLCYGCRYCEKINNCTECEYGRYLVGCKNCLCCTNLVQKNYAIFNEVLEPEVYEKRKKEFLSLPQRKQQELWQAFFSHQIVPAVYSYKCENCSGDGMINCTDSHACYDVEDLERCSYIHGGSHMKNTYDGIGGTLENCLEFCRAGVTGNQCCFVIDAMNSADIYYSAHMYNASNCFGCVGLHTHEHHCIFNTAYSTLEYEELAGKIIDHMRETGEWGEFFPHEMSPYGYNETDAIEYFPLSENEVKGMPRFNEWRNGEKGKVKSEKGEGEGRGGNTKDIIQNTKGDTEKEIEIDLKHAPLGRGVAEGRGVAMELGKELPNTEGCNCNTQCNPPARSATPLHRGADATTGWNWYTESSKTFEGSSIAPLLIDQYDEKIVGFEIAQKNIDELLNGVILCEVTKKPFKIIKQELVFYIENHIPIPTKHPELRKKERSLRRNPRKLHVRACAECGKEITTTYASNRPERVVCEECYRELIY